MFSITNSLLNFSKNSEARIGSYFLAIIIDAIVGAIILSIGIAALSGRLHFHQSASITMIAVGTFNLTPIIFVSALSVNIILLFSEFITHSISGRTLFLKRN